MPNISIRGRYTKKSNMEAPNRVGDENNNVILNDPPANYISHVEIYFGFKIITIIGADYIQTYYLKGQ
jgi:hypothetical protein